MTGTATTPAASPLRQRLRRRFSTAVAPLTRAPARPEPVGPGAEVVRAEGVTVRRGGRALLDGVDLTVRAGELLALVGPNGAGKSTLLSALSGDVTGGPAKGERDSGTVGLFGRELGEWNPPELALRRAVLPQEAAVSFPFSVTELVAMGRAPWAGLSSPAEDDALTRSAMERVGVTHLADRRFPTLSGGERARVMLARVLAQDTGLLLLDEPTAALDIRHQELVLSIARTLASHGGAVIVVLHDLGLAAAYAHRVAVLSGGQVAAQGTPADVFSASLLSAVYQHEVEVLPHPRTGVPLVVPLRSPGCTRKRPQE
ncbi:heme ABC transporter ATP-binding protein [Nocardiopsis metallicus]|uniref:Iron complex transport system ATP-binding protein n=1 Tax=Nocardiopsis metallicus TaxID=179819 RepID=A0A840WU28_9ACTN|nr:heme ABC transporter ATP-binding protein [Nocardiopsis metallicus]MBB5495515.1 iron complex transport system ATP-binding protein [Nocardiopsis metallicus]